MKRNDLVTVILPEHLTFIGIGAFEQNKLESIRIPEKVKSIEHDAFASNKLTIVDFSTCKALINIEGSAFSYNQLTSIELPSSVETSDGKQIEGGTVTQELEKSYSVEFRKNE